MTGLALTIGTGLGAMMSGTASAGAVALTSSYVLAAGATAALGMNLMFSKGSGARFGHNQHENNQFRDAMNELGYGRSDPQWEKAHRALMKYKKSGGYFDKYRDLLKFIKGVLGR